MQNTNARYEAYTIQGRNASLPPFPPPSLPCPAFPIPPPPSPGISVSPGIWYVLYLGGYLIKYLLGDAKHTF